MTFTTESDLGSALIALLKNPEQRTTYGTFGQHYVEQYDWGRVAELFLEQVGPFVGGDGRRGI